MADNNFSFYCFQIPYLDDKLNKENCGQFELTSPKKRRCLKIEGTRAMIEFRE